MGNIVKNSECNITYTDKPVTLCDRPMFNVIPRRTVTLNRMYDIRKAIERYKDNKLEVPQEWVDEYVELEEWIRNDK